MYIYIYIYLDIHVYLYIYIHVYLYGGFNKRGVPQNGWFIKEIPIKWIEMDDLGVPP